MGLESIHFIFAG